MDDESWHAKLKVMSENLHHHIEEEEREMFVQARRVFDRDVLDQLGRQMQDIKTQARAA